MTLKKTAFLIWIFLLITRSSVPCYTDITNEALYERLVQSDTLLLLDVREVYEYQAGHIAEPAGQLPLTPVNMPLSSNVLSNEYTRLPKDIDIIVYCQAGGRSKTASQFLNSKGFTKIFNKTGGFSSWPYESRTGGFGDHSGHWIHRADPVTFPILTAVGPDTSKLYFTSASLPESDDSLYVELHFSPANLYHPDDVPDSDLEGLYRFTVLDRFGLSKFTGDSLVCPDSMDIILCPAYTKEKTAYLIKSQSLNIFIPNKGWTALKYQFKNYSFYHRAAILRKWYHAAVNLMETDVISYVDVENCSAQAFPNPFNCSVRIITNSEAIIQIYDIHGRLIEKLKSNFWVPDKSLGSGVYLITIRQLNILITKKVTYLK